MVCKLYLFLYLTTIRNYNKKYTRKNETIMSRPRINSMTNNYILSFNLQDNFIT